MSPELLSFYLFAGFIVLGCLLIILGKDLIHASYALALVLLSMAALFLTLQATYIAVVQLFMYAGGVVVLLIFGIMSSVRKRGERPTSERRNLWIALPVSVVLLYMFIQLIIQWPMREQISDQPQAQVRVIGQQFFTDHLITFELTAYLLLAALVAAVYLAKKSVADE